MAAEHAPQADFVGTPSTAPVGDGEPVGSEVPRPHLSIGEVLSLLQDEYPEITISKIRFLEAQGLLNPERTPSGYRKFYDQDVEQLRWVLQQQKENFLPLKVIKDRLAAGRLDDPPSASGVLDLGVAVDPGGADRPEAPILATTTAAAPSTPVPPAPGPRQRTSSEATERRREPLPAASPPIPPRPVAAATTSLDGASPTVPATSTDRRVGVASSVSLTTAELCAASGLDRRSLAEIERLGLVVGTSVGGESVYDDDALEACRLIAAMVAGGFEPRHLRMFKVAAEREAGFYEQLALPRLRGQRTEPRDAVTSEVMQLAADGARLHEVLLRRALRPTLGPLPPTD